MVSLTGAVASKNVTEAHKGRLGPDGNRTVSANAKAGLTARMIIRAPDVLVGVPISKDIGKVRKQVLVIPRHAVMAVGA